MNDKKTPKMNNGTKTKIREVLERLQKGWQKYEIVDFLVDKYELSESRCNTIYYEAFKLLEEKNPLSDIVNKTKDEALARATSLYKDTLAKQDFKTATRCLDMINKLNGLYVEKQEVKQEVTTWTYEYNGENNK